MEHQPGKHFRPSYCPLNNIGPTKRTKTQKPYSNPTFLSKCSQYETCTTSALIPPFTVYVTLILLASFRKDSQSGLTWTSLVANQKDPNNLDQHKNYHFKNFQLPKHSCQRSNSSRSLVLIIKFSKQCLYLNALKSKGKTSNYHSVHYCNRANWY